MSTTNENTKAKDLAACLCGKAAVGGKTCPDCRAAAKNVTDTADPTLQPSACVCVDGQSCTCADKSACGKCNTDKAAPATTQSIPTNIPGLTIDPHANDEPNATYVSRGQPLDEAAVQRHAQDIDNERNKMARAEQQWEKHPKNIDKLAGKLEEKLPMLKPEGEAALDHERPLRLVPLQVGDALLTSSLVMAHGANAATTTVETHKGVVLATREIVVSLDTLADHDLVLGGEKSNATGVRDTFLSHEQLRVTRRATTVNADDDISGTGIALDVTHVGKNNSYLLPIDGSRDKRFGTQDRKTLALPNGNEIDDRLIVLCQDGVKSTNLRVGDIVWLLRDRYPYRVQNFRTTSTQ